MGYTRKLSPTIGAFEVDPILSNEGGLDNSILSIYPNPATTTITLDIAADIVDIAVYGVSGRIVVTKSVIDQRIDVSDLKEGMYFIRIKTENEIQNINFVISN